MNETTGSSASTGSSTYFYIGSYAGASQVISIKSADLAASRTASCTVNIDDASKVNMAYYDGSKVELCKDCLCAHINNFEPDTFLWILQKMDVPYIPWEWNTFILKALREES